MTPDSLASLHARCFTTPAPWSAASFAAFLADPAVFLIADPQGRAFLLGRVIAGEAELLTLATAPESRRLGLARDLLARFDRQAQAPPPPFWKSPKPTPPPAPFMLLPAGSRPGGAPAITARQVRRRLLH